MVSRTGEGARAYFLYFSSEKLSTATLILPYMQRVFIQPVFKYMLKMRYWISIWQ